MVTTVCLRSAWIFTTGAANEFSRKVSQVKYEETMKPMAPIACSHTGTCDQRKRAASIAINTNQATQSATKIVITILSQGS